jgi:ADP-ribosylation factor-like protein 6
VLDSTDTIRMCVAKDELEQLVEHKEFASRRVPILFFANKMDLANALTPVECMEQLELDKLPGKSWHIAYGSLWVYTLKVFPYLTLCLVTDGDRASNAITGRGVEEGIEWLADQFAKNKSRK